MLVAVTLATIWTGGFRDEARFILIAVGALGLVSSAVLFPERMSSAISRPPVLGLLGLAGLSAISLIWTEVKPESVILFALTPAAFAGIAVFAASDAWLGDRPALVGSWLAVLATAAATTGLSGVLFEIDPWAFQLAGKWRPAGFLEYPPALALLQLGAMTVLARMYIEARGVLRALAGASLMLGSATILLAQSRMVIILAVLLIGAWVIWPERALATGRAESIRPIVAWALGGILLVVTIRLFEGWAGALLCALLLSVVPRAVEHIRRPVESTGRRDEKSSRSLALVLVGLGVALVAALAIPLGDASSGQGIQGDQGLDHGRIGLWKDSLPAVGERPVFGHGTGSFLVATVDDQDQPTRFAHSLVVESAVELGLIGAALALVVLIGALVRAWRSRFDSGAWRYIPMVVGFCGLALVDWTWHLAAVGAIWALCLGSILLEDTGPVSGPEVEVF